MGKTAAHVAGCLLLVLGCTQALARDGGGVAKSEKWARDTPPLCANCVCGRARSAPRLVGGTRVRGKELPWLAAVYSNDVLTGGGALVSNRYVLTAASTVAGVASSHIQVTFGVSDLCQPDVMPVNVSADVVLKPRQQADLALIRLVSRVPLGSGVSPICLPPYAMSAYYNKVGHLASWGRNVSGDSNSSVCRPKMLAIPILNPQDCSAAAGDKGCVGTNGTPSLVCQSDAGGIVQHVTQGAVIYYQLVGILSGSTNCGDAHIGPAQFTRVARYLSWILETTSDSCFCRAPT